MVKRLSNAVIMPDGELVNPDFGGVWKVTEDAANMLNRFGNNRLLFVNDKPLMKLMGKYILLVIKIL